MCCISVSVLRLSITSRAKLIELGFVAESVSVVLFILITSNYYYLSLSGRIASRFYTTDFTAVICLLLCECLIDLYAECFAPSLFFLLIERFCLRSCHKHLPLVRRYRTVQARAVIVPRPYERDIMLGH